MADSSELTGVVDEQLAVHLRRRLRCSEGEKSAHCFVSAPAAGDPGGEVEFRGSIAGVGVAATVAEKLVLDRGGGDPVDTITTPVRQADGPSSSPHFAMSTPPASTEATPRVLRDCDDIRALLGEVVPLSGAAGADSLDDLQYEWQFEFLKGLPRDKALALIKVIRDSEKGRVQAEALAAKLQRDVEKLKERSKLEVGNCSMLEGLAKTAPALANEDEFGFSCAAGNHWNDSDIRRGTCCKLLTTLATCLCLFTLICLAFANLQAPIRSSVTGGSSQVLGGDDCARGEGSQERFSIAQQGYLDPVIAFGDIMSAESLAVGSAGPDVVHALSSVAVADGASSISLRFGSSVEFNATSHSNLAVNSGSFASESGLIDESGGSSSRLLADISQSTSADSTDPSDALSLNAALGHVSTSSLASLPQDVGDLTRPQDLGLMSAVVLSESHLELHHTALSEDASFPRDATADLGSVLDPFPGVHTAYRLGRLVARRTGSAEEHGVAIAQVFLGNDGLDMWPSSTMLRLISGSDLGLIELSVGEVQSGAHVELTLQFKVPLASDVEDAEDSVRSAWVLEASGEPFGPLLLVEVRWV
mmetsp:Transcript_51470/g.130904  ORF Transcript_51470/g.130904 Transcript_51470/m.130904 type:complete len:589 (-) Transcript_51470:142-1908(-)